MESVVRLMASIALGRFTGLAVFAPVVVAAPQRFPDGLQGLGLLQELLHAVYVGPQLLSQPVGTAPRYLDLDPSVLYRRLPVADSGQRTVWLVLLGQLHQCLGSLLCIQTAASHNDVYAAVLAVLPRSLVQVHLAPEVVARGRRPEDDSI